jgi:hypothetical protein
MSNSVRESAAQHRGPRPGGDRYGTTQPGRPVPQRHRHRNGRQADHHRRSFRQPRRTIPADPSRGEDGPADVTTGGAVGNRPGRRRSRPRTRAVTSTAAEPIPVLAVALRSLHRHRVPPEPREASGPALPEESSRRSQGIPQRRPAVPGLLRAPRHLSQPGRRSSAIPGRTGRSGPAGGRYPGAYAGRRLNPGSVHCDGQ